MEGQRVCPKPPASDPDIPLHRIWGKGGERGEKREEGGRGGVRGKGGENCLLEEVVGRAVCGTNERVPKL